MEPLSRTKPGLHSLILANFEDMQERYLQHLTTEEPLNRKSVFERQTLKEDYEMAGLMRNEALGIKQSTHWAPDFERVRNAVGRTAEFPEEMSDTAVTEGIQRLAEDSYAAVLALTGQSVEYEPGPERAARHLKILQKSQQILALEAGSAPLTNEQGVRAVTAAFAAYGFIPKEPYTPGLGVRTQALSDHLSRVQAFSDSYQPQEQALDGEGQPWRNEYLKPSHSLASLSQRLGNTSAMLRFTAEEAVRVTDEVQEKLRAAPAQNPVEGEYAEFFYAYLGAVQKSGGEVLSDVKQAASQSLSASRPGR